MVFGEVELVVRPKGPAGLNEFKRSYADSEALPDKHNGICERNGAPFVISIESPTRGNDKASNSPRSVCHA
jgi:hypothetical protein